MPWQAKIIPGLGCPVIATGWLVASAAAAAPSAELALETGRSPARDARVQRVNLAAGLIEPRLLGGEWRLHPMAEASFGTLRAAIYRRAGFTGIDRTTACWAPSAR